MKPSESISRIMCLSLIVFVLEADEVESLEPVSTTLAMGTAFLVSGLIASYPKFKSHFFETCDDRWITPRISALEQELRSKLHGQHLVISPVVRALGAHVNNPHPAKALVLSFHGWTGNGKNFVSNIIADHLYMDGQNSTFMHTFISTHSFPHARFVDDYKDVLRREIQAATERCGRSLFVFDEVDKLPEGLLDSIKPFLDYHAAIQGVDHRKNIYIFLSNAGGNDIGMVAKQHWKNGGRRDDLTLKDFESVINKAAFNENGGLRKSNVLDSSLVSLFVPFLPLERSHVLLCIKDELSRKGHRDMLNDPEVVLAIANEMTYTSPDKLYSTTGCKRVSDKVDLIVSERKGFY